MLGTIKYAIIFPVALLAACGTPDRLLPTPQTTAAERVSSRYASIEVLEVSLPTYAAGEEIVVESEGGGLEASDLLWADDPTRAITLALARNLSEVTGARVAPEPWPFDNFPGARVDVRVEQFLATSGGTIMLSGQYFVAALDGQGRDRARLFSLSVPVDPETGIGGAISARGQLVANLAVMIARDGLN
jgi:hypothetical protein